MDTRYVITSSPHIRSTINTRKIMMSVLIALMPATVVGCVFFGFRALFIILLSVGSAVLAEALFNIIVKRKQTVGDLSACVTGLLLALSLPSTVPLWIPIVGAFFAIIIVKQLFGGIGKNFLNPALAARVMLSVSWPKEMTNWVKPFATDGVSLIANVDITKIESTVTPLSSMKASTYSFRNIIDLFWGNIGGCIGETSAALLLLGAIYLMFKKVIRWEIPVTFIGSVALLSYLFPTSGTPLYYMLAQIFAGGLFISAFFMATDYSTAPITGRGKFIYGILCGVITFFLRRYSGYPEGVSYAILLMNIFSYTLDKITGPRRYGNGGTFYGRKKDSRTSEQNTD